MNSQDKLKSKVAKAVEKNFGDPNEIEPVDVATVHVPANPIFDVLIQKLIDIILGLLDSCAMNSSVDAAAENAIDTKNIFVRYSIRRAVRRRNSGFSDDQWHPAENSIRDVMTGNSKAEVVKLIEDMKKVTPDWSMF